jgi:hypothetical protein
MAASGSKEEFPPLLPAGFHVMDMKELRRICVAQFPHSLTRPKVMDGLEQVVERLNRSGLPMEAWIDGSFLTQKLNPEDSDIVANVAGAVYDGASSTQKLVIQWLSQAELRKDFLCDNYCFIEYDRTHSLSGVSEWTRAYWVRQFGFSRGVEMKGMAVIKLPFIVT